MTDLKLLDCKIENIVNSLQDIKTKVHDTLLMCFEDDTDGTTLISELETSYHKIYLLIGYVDYAIKEIELV